MYQTGPGPYRPVSDGELRSIFYLTPQTGRSFSLPVSTTPPPGTDQPQVTRLLRAMLYLRVEAPNQRDALYRAIEAGLPGRNNIAIKAALLSRCRQVIETPWAYPALHDTDSCKRMYNELKPIMEASDQVANAGSDPVSSMGIGAVLTKLLSSAAAFGYGLATYFGGKSKDYYDFYMRRISQELALRGVPESSL